MEKYSMENLEINHGGNALDIISSQLIDKTAKDIDNTTIEDKFKNLKALAGLEHVNHPQHYNRPDGMECIDEMELIFGPEVVMHFCICNAWKYRYRAADKNGEEDLRKSDWYINKYKELKDKHASFRIRPNISYAD